MTTYLPRWFTLLAVVLPFVPVIAAAPDDEVVRLVKQLGDDDFQKREAATTRLKEMGEPALDALKKAATNSDSEVRRRAADIRAVIEDKHYGEQLRLVGHRDSVLTVSISADGKRVLTSSKDKTLRLWEADTGKELLIFAGHTDLIYGAALSPDGKRLLSGSYDNTLRLWDTATGREVLKMEDQPYPITDLVFGPEGTAVSCGGNGIMYRWDLSTGKKAGVFTGHTDFVFHIAYSDQTKLVATAGVDPSIRLWNLETRKEVRTLVGHKNAVYSVCFSRDGKRLVSTGGDNMLAVWDVKTGRELKRIKDTNADCAAFSPDGKRIVSCGYHDNAVRLWDVETGAALHKYAGHADCVTRVAFFPDGKRIVSASPDGTARVWRVPR